MSFWMVLGPSGRPVTIYAGFEQVGLTDRVHPVFKSLCLSPSCLGFYPFWSLFVHLNLMQIKISGTSYNSPLIFLMLTSTYLYFLLMMMQLSLFLPSWVGLASSLPFTDLCASSAHSPGYFLQGKYVILHSQCQFISRSPNKPMAWRQGHTLSNPHWVVRCWFWES